MGYEKNITGLQETPRETQSDRKPTHISPPHPIWLSKRFFVSLLLFVGCVNMQLIRGNMSIAIVEMTSYKNITVENRTIVKQPEYNWDSKTIGFVVSIFSYGYLFSVVAGFVTTKFGGSATFGVSMMVNGALTMFNPFSLRMHLVLFLACRGISGFTDSLAYASIAEISARWAPVQERSRMMSYSLSGIYVGTAVAYPFCGFIAYKCGWPMVFYVTGIMCFTCALIWQILVRNEPSKDKWISKTELNYILKGTTNTSRKKVVHPIKSILLSMPFWALCVAKFAYSWTFTLLVYSFPLYVKDMTDRTTDEIGLISSIPNIVCIFIIPVAGTFMDYCQNNSALQVTQIHKILMSVGCIGGSILLIISATVNNFTISMICFVIIKILISFNFLIPQLISIYMAPQHSSLLSGFSAFWQKISNILSLTSVGFMVENHSSQEWSNCFYLAAAILMCCAITFVIFGSSELQPWASPETQLNQEYNASSGTGERFSYQRTT